MAAIIARSFSSDTSIGNRGNLSPLYVDSGSFIHAKDVWSGCRTAHQVFGLNHGFGTKKTAQSLAHASPTNSVERSSSYIVGAVTALLALVPVGYSAETLPSTVTFVDVQNTADKERVMKLEKAKMRLAVLSEKEAGWKGDESVKLNEEVKAATQTFLENYFSLGNMKEPFIGLDADGDISLFWKDESIIIDMSVTSEGTYSYYARITNGKSFSVDESGVHETFPPVVLQSLIVI